MNPEVKLALARLLKYLRIGLTPIALAFLLLAIFQSRARMAAIFSDISPVTLILLFISWLGAHLASVLFATLVLSGMDSKAGYGTVLKIHLQSIPARYIPGGVWHTVARVSKLKELGIGGGKLSRFVVLENALSLLVAFSIGGLAVNISGPEAWKTVAAMLSFGSFAALMFLPVFSLRKPMGFGSTLNGTVYLKIIAAIIVFWLCASTAFMFYADSVSPVTGFAGWLYTAGSYMFSWGVGFISILTPQGMGVFELVASSLLDIGGTNTSQIALLAGYRIIILIFDIIIWQITNIIVYYKKNVRLVVGVI